VGQQGQLTSLEVLNLYHSLRCSTAQHVQALAHVGPSHTQLRGNFEDTGRAVGVIECLARLKEPRPCAQGDVRSPRMLRISAASRPSAPTQLWCLDKPVWMMNTWMRLHECTACRI
jgi:hypothetical protein